MQYQVVEMLYPQLNQVEQLLKQDFELRNGSIFDFVTFQKADYIEYFLPAMLVLLFSSKYKNIKNSLQMSCVTQYIYLGTKIHNQVQEQQEENNQFPILIGDYLYGKFFVALCNANRLEFLEPLSQAIKMIHEASIEESQMVAINIGKTATIKLAEKKWGRFFGLCCQIGAVINNDTYEQRELAYKLGKTFGSYYGITGTAVNKEWIEEIKLKMLLLVKGMSDNFIKQGFINIVDHLYQGITCNTKKSFLVG